MLIDTHAHLNIDEFNNIIDEIINRAQENKVNKILVIGMDKKANLRALELSRIIPNIYPTIGIHPSSIDSESLTDLEELLINNKDKVVAIGECGIDLYWRKDNLDKQILFFEGQIELSIKYDLPLVIHTRNSFNEAYQCLLKYKGKVKGVFHCYSGTIDDLKKVIDLGFYIGVDGPITFKKNDDLREIIKEVDINYLLLETDSPYLAPVPFRGKRNEPSNLVYILESVSKIKNMSEDLVSNITSNNAKKLFNL